MESSKTVGVAYMDPILAKQREDVAKMRTSLLACDADPRNATNALKHITVLQVYHQVSRIIRYTELMDKLEQILYASIEIRIDNLDEESLMTMTTLMTLQERLQKSIIESNKLLQPYLDMTAYIESNSSDIVDEREPGEVVQLNAAKREKLRTAANKVLKELNIG